MNTMTNTVLGATATTFVARTWHSTQHSDHFSKVGLARKVSSKVGTPQKCEHFDSEKGISKYGSDAQLS